MTLLAGWSLVWLVAWHPNGLPGGGLRALRVWRDGRVSELELRSPWLGLLHGLRDSIYSRRYVRVRWQRAATACVIGRVRLLPMVLDWHVPQQIECIAMLVRRVELRALVRYLVRERGWLVHRRLIGSDLTA